MVTIKVPPPLKNGHFLRGRRLGPLQQDWGLLDRTLDNISKIMTSIRLAWHLLALNFKTKNFHNLKYLHYFVAASLCQAFWYHLTFTLNFCFVNSWASFWKTFLESNSLWKFAVRDQPLRSMICFERKTAASFLNEAWVSSWQSCFST